MSSRVEPEPGVVVVQLPSSEFGDVPVVEKQYDSMVYGVVIRMHQDDYAAKEHLLHKKAYWRRYKDDCRLPDNQALVEIKDVLGYEDS